VSVIDPLSTPDAPSERQNSSRGLRDNGARFRGQQAVNVRGHLLKELVPAELVRMCFDLFGVDLDVCQTSDRRRDRLDRLFGKENT